MRRHPWVLSRLTAMGLTCVALLSNPSIADADKYEEPLCMSKVKSEEDINICRFATAKYLEQQVKEAEEKILATFTGIQLERFQEAQAAWRALVERDCEIQSYFYEGAGIYAAIQSQCLQNHYQERLEILKHYQCAEHNFLYGCDQAITQQQPAN